MANLQNLTNTEEQVIVKHILKLVARGFPPRLTAVADIANSLRAERNLGYVSLNQPSTFVKRQPELTVKFNRKYDYKRALCEDPEVIQGWFSLVANIKAKYSIQDDDTYNFDKASFIIGQISTGAVVIALERQGRLKVVQLGNREQIIVIQGVNAKGQAILPFIIFKVYYYLSSQYKKEDLPQDQEIRVSNNSQTTNKLSLDWLQYFNAHTKERTISTYRLLVINGYKSYNLLKFQQYCKDNKIITVYMPAYSSHLLQPLNVGCFAPLKKAYGR